MVGTDNGIAAMANEVVFGRIVGNDKTTESHKGLALV